MKLYPESFRDVTIFLIPRCTIMKTLISVYVFFSFCSVNAQNSRDTLSIYFDFNSHALNTKAIGKLTLFNSSDHGSINVVIAHCDTSGSKKYNLNLAQQRIDAVLELIDSTAQSTIAEGENVSSKVINYDAALFRRVDIIYDASSSLSESKSPLTLKESFEAFIGTEEKKRVTIDLSILFYPGEAVLLPESASEVLELYRILKHNPTIDVHIHGHVCCGENYILSKNRANEVYNYCLSKGISRTRMKYTGHSNSQPKVWPEVTAEDKDSNRRVSVEFTKR